MLLNLVGAVKAKETVAKVSYYILEDKSLQLTPGQALDAFNKGKYALQATNQFNPGFTKAVYWLAVKTEGNVNADSLTLVIGQPAINKIDFYEAAGNQLNLIYQTGDLYPYQQRPLPTPGYSFPLTHLSALYLLRVDKHNESLQLTFNAVNATGFIRAETNSSIITGSLTGIILLLLIFGVYLALITRKMIYIFYVLYITSGWLWVLADLGYGYKYLWPGSPWFASRSRPLFCDLTIALSLQYLVYYLGTIRIRLMEKLLRVTSYIAFFFVALWLIPVEVYDAKELSWVMLISLPTIAATYVVLTFITLITEAARRNIMAIFYLGALIPLMMLTLINVLNHSAVINISGTSLEHYGVAVGYACEAIILTFGLVYRFNMYRIEKERLQVAYERQQKENAKALIDTEAKERRRIADELHDIAGSMLSAAKLNITSIREKEFLTSDEGKLKLEKAEEAINAVAGSVRNLSHALSPVMLDKIGFKKSVEKIISFFTSSGKINIETLIIGFDEYDPSLEHIYTVLYSIIYELLNNMVKHSAASNAMLQLVEHDDGITLVAEDNGRGLKEEFDKQNTKGLAGIISKINYFNGSIELDGGQGGLIISIEIPKRMYETKDSIS
jgi:two-component system, sensor histidine kinase LadS